ncbi:MAG: hypothetical protein GF364_12575 [Candidatus Lokiarchaeota archaeon]|nr:hypothetical protein [Candidatus Lokiarchaeota archaeon]
MKKIKEKLNPQSEAVELFKYAADDVQKMLHYLSATIEAFCKHDEELIEEKSIATLKTEVKLQVAHQDIVDKMYSRETMNFAREDRLFIINSLIEIADLADFIVRRIRVHHPKMSEDIADILLTVSADLRKFGGLLEELVLSLLDNFEKAAKLTWEFHKLERSMWKYEIEFLNNIYKLGTKPKDTVYYEILMKNIRLLVMKSVRFSEGARKLIIKYTF